MAANQSRLSTPAPDQTITADRQEALERSARSKRDNEENIKKISNLKLGESDNNRRSSEEAEDSSGSFDRDSQAVASYGIEADDKHRANKSSEEVDSRDLRLPADPLHSEADVKRKPSAGRPPMQPG